MNRPPRQALHLAALTALELLLLLAAAEGLIAWTGLDMRLLGKYLYYQEADVPLHRPSRDLVLHYELVPSSSRVFARGRRVTVNSLGFRGPERTAAKPRGVRRIICIGSSNTYGADVSDGQTYPDRLEARLNAGHKGAYEVWNAGVNAYTMAQSLAVARRVIKDYDPDLIIFQLNNSGRRAFLAGQDFRPYFAGDPGLYLENLDTVWPDSFNFLRHWRLARAVTAWLNCRRIPRGYRGGDLNRSGRMPKLSLELFSDFYAEYSGRVPMALLVVPGGEDLAGGLERPGLPVLRILESLPAGHSPDFDKIHPPPYVYDWYARQIASRLRGYGLLPPAN